MGGGIARFCIKHRVTTILAFIIISLVKKHVVEFILDLCFNIRICF